MVCTRCHGTGVHIAHPRQGTGVVCFRCGGSKVDPKPDPTPAQLERRAKSKAARDARKDAAYLATLPEHTCIVCGTTFRVFRPWSIEYCAACEKCHNHYFYQATPDERVQLRREIVANRGALRDATELVSLPF